MSSADQHTRRNQTGFNNELSIRWYAGSSFCSLLVVFSRRQFFSPKFNYRAHQPVRQNWKISNIIDHRKTTTKKQKTKTPPTSFCDPAQQPAR